MKDLDIKKLIDNIYEVAKRQGKKMYDLEAAAQVSQGYFSRLRAKEEKASAPGIEIIAAVAAELGTTVDALINCDCSSTSDADKYVTAFLEKLISGTKNFDIVWDTDTEESIANIMAVKPGAPAHPLFRKVYDAGKVTAVYDSAFHKNESEAKVRIAPPFYHTKINNGKNELYLSRIMYALDGGDGVYEYEMYMCEGQNASALISAALSVANPASPVCHSVYNVQTEVGSYLKAIYSMAGETSAHVKIDKSVKDAISMFMSGL